MCLRTGERAVPQVLGLRGPGSQLLATLGSSPSPWVRALQAGPGRGRWGHAWGVGWLGRCWSRALISPHLPSPSRTGSRRGDWPERTEPGPAQGCVRERHRAGPAERQIEGGAPGQRRLQPRPQGLLHQQQDPQAVGLQAAVRVASAGGPWRGGAPQAFPRLSRVTLVATADRSRSCPSEACGSEISTPGSRWKAEITSCRPLGTWGRVDLCAEGGLGDSPCPSPRPLPGWGAGLGCGQAGGGCEGPGSG